MYAQGSWQMSRLGFGLGCTVTVTDTVTVVVTVAVMVTVAVRIIVRVKVRVEGDNLCPMNRSQNGMAQAILYIPFHCGALSLSLHLLRVNAGSKPP